MHHNTAPVLSLSTRVVINNTVSIDLLHKQRNAIRWMWFSNKPLITGEHPRAAWQRVIGEIVKHGDNV